MYLKQQPPPHTPRGIYPGNANKLVNIWNHSHNHLRGLPRWLSGEESTCQYRRLRFNPWVGKIPQRRKWQPAPVFLPGKSHDRGTWQAIVHGVKKSWTWLRDWTTKTNHSRSINDSKKNHLIISLDVERAFNKFQIYSW